MRHQFNQIKNLILAIVFVLSSICGNAFNLPSKSINGKEYYYYNVQPNETIYSIAQKLKTTKEEIVKYNPSALDGLKVHDVLYFPKAETTISTQTVYIDHIVKKKETVYGICNKYGITVDRLIADNPSAKDGIKAGETLRIAQGVIPNIDESPKSNNNTIISFESSTDNENNSQTELTNNDLTPNSNSETSSIDNYDISTDSNATNIQTDSNPVNVAIILPFMLHRENALKQDKLYTDFYRGFLYALNQLEDTTNITVSIYDTADSISVLKSILAKDEMTDVDLIIAPDDNDHLDELASFAQDNECYVLNLFNVKNDLHKNNQYILQANIGQDEMYSKAFNYIICKCKDKTPVFLRNKEHLSDKIKFTTQLKVALDSANIKYLSINYTDYLTDEDIESLKDTTSYLFIPTSSSKNDLISVASTLVQFKENFANRDIELFGYPEWITYSGTTAERMAQIGTTFYSRFKNYTALKPFNNDEFKKWFGDKPILSYPNQALLGFDVAQFILKSVAENGVFSPECQHEGLQSNFEFIKAKDNLGYSNNSLIFITRNSDN